MKPKYSDTAQRSPLSTVNPERVRTRFTKEFKLQAVELMRLGQKNPTELAMELGIRRNQLYKWADTLQTQGEDLAFQGPGRRSAEQDDEVVRLRRELKQITEERDILKKAATYFARQLP